jgi:hypothetical protein
MQVEKKKSLLYLHAKKTGKTGNKKREKPFKLTKIGGLKSTRNTLKTLKIPDFFVSDKILYFSFVFNQKLYIYTIIKTY